MWGKKHQPTTNTNIICHFQTSTEDISAAWFLVLKWPRNPVCKHKTPRFLLASVYTRDVWSVVSLSLHIRRLMCRRPQCTIETSDLLWASVYTQDVWSVVSYCYSLVWYFIWLPKSGLFDTEPRKNPLHLLKENKQTEFKWEDPCRNQIKPTQDQCLSLSEDNFRPRQRAFILVTLSASQSPPKELEKKIKPTTS